jgi:hypothetical protein
MKEKIIVKNIAGITITHQIVNSNEEYIEFIDKVTEAYPFCKHLNIMSEPVDDFDVNDLFAVYEGD